MLSLKKILTILLVFFSLLFTTNYLLPAIHADETIEDLQKQIDELNKAREQSIAATKPLEGQLSALQRQLAQIQASLDNLAAAIKKKQQDLDLREEKIAQEQVILEVSIKSYYINSFQATPLLVLLSSAHPSDLFRELSFQLSSAKQNRQTIVSITTEILDLLKQKDKLEKDKAGLSSLQAQVDTNAQFIGGEVKKAKAYQADLTSKIVALTAKQQQILSQRLASLNISRSAATLGACSDDRQIDPGFSPRMAFFTYGVPNRVGMNQYGAYGRAKAGQNYETILKAYYNFDSLENRNATIKVDGYGSYALEDYVKRIYEVPDGWGSQGGMEALKAQAIAARSYALAYTNNGAGSICTTQQCQVFQPNPKGGNWEAAVNATAGQVMVQGGSPIKAWFSSTHGGYIFSSGEIGWSGTSWTKHAVDTISSSASGFTDLTSGAYDKDSPWFYCDWGSRSQHSKTAWLKLGEVADIVNTLLLNQADFSISEHLYQTDKPNPAGVDNWDEEKIKQELRSRGLTPYNSISSVSISADFSGGRVSSVNISGDGGSRSFAGADFKNRFNLRAPANLQIVGPLFNTEQR